VSYYYSRDHLGSVRELLNSSGTIVARYGYDMYGRTTLISGSNLATKQYAEMYMHQPSGMYLSRGGEKPSTGRIYDANTGRWPSRDPLEELGGLNLYAYCLNNPIWFIDPDGLRSRGVPPRGPVTTPQGDPAGGNVIDDAEDTENKDMTHGHADYGGGFAHCMANCLLKRRYGALADWIIRIGWDIINEHHHPDLPGFPDAADETSPGDIIANGQGARAADGPCSCEAECLKRFPKLPKDQYDVFRTFLRS
jgi:RHS repeat-associated protein